LFDFYPATGGTLVGRAIGSPLIKCKNISAADKTSGAQTRTVSIHGQADTVILSFFKQYLRTGPTSFPEFVLARDSIPQSLRERKGFLEKFSRAVQILIDIAAWPVL